MTMTYEQYLLVKLAEEASEVAQIALKSSQFGLNETYSRVGKSNLYRLNAELNDLLAVVGELNASCGLSFVQDEEARKGKVYKMRNFLAYSISLGKIEPVNLNEVLL